MSTLGISIVVPAYNEENFLPATLASINEARKYFEATTNLRTEIVVVNNASTDQTEKIALANGAVVVPHPIRNISSVRNAGIRKSLYEVVVTIDADSFLPKDALVKIWNLMSSNRYVGGALGVKIISERISVRIMAFIIQRIVVLISGIYGAMFFFSREAALEIGGFPEDRLIAEDTAFAIALRAYGRKQKKKFARLKSVQVGTLDRKEIDLRSLLPLILQMIKGAVGAKQKKEDLKYWYDPKR